MCLTELSKKDKRWREIAYNICGNKTDADELVQKMYIRRYENDRGQELSEYYIGATMRSIFLNDKKTNRHIPKDTIYKGADEDKFEPNDYEQKLLDKTESLTYNQKELLELTYDYSLRDIQQTFNVNYQYAYRETKKAREKVLNGDLTLYNNKRLKYKIMEIKNEAYYNSLDKRTNEYKEYKKSRESIGLGDTIEKVLEATGIKAFVKMVTSGDCGCEERKRKLNELFKYKEKPNCLDADQIEDYKNFINTRNMKLTGGGKAVGTLSSSDVDFVYSTYSEVFNVKIQRPTCSNCRGAALALIQLIYKLDTVYYNNI